jgi:hypothetical protein
MLRCPVTMTPGLARPGLQVSRAVKQMRALMPGTQWEAKLGAGGTAFMSFCSILGGSGLAGGGSGGSKG